MNREELFEKYENLIWYAANCYRGISSAVDVEDLAHDGMVLLLETWERDDIPDEVKEPHFKKSLFFALRSAAYKQAGLTKQLVGHPAGDEEAGINLDQIFATSDMQVLSEVYAKEFVGEMKKMLSPVEARVLDFMLNPEFDEVGEVTKRGDWVPAAAARLKRTTNELYYEIWKIQRAARALLPRFFEEGKLEEVAA